MYTTGEKPGKGTYKCVSCGVIVVLDGDTDNYHLARVAMEQNLSK